MKPSKLPQAHMLLDAMNEIDERYLEEALSFSAKAPSRRPLKAPMVRVASGVAALAAVLSLVILGASRGFPGFDDKKNPAESVADITPSPEALESLLQGCAESASFTPLSADGLSLFDGTVRLLIKSPDSETVYVSRPLNAAEQEQISLEFERTGKALTESEAAKSNWTVWVALGNGRVVTPCLNLSHGNVGMGELFDYESERLPTETFFNLLNTLI